VGLLTPASVEQQSFDNIGSYWIRELKENGPENVHLCLVGNKCDLEDERVRVLL
jgi:GTPase SAR1 family protein